MTSGLEPYASYNESGTPWLGSVPSHWRVRRLKRLCSGGALYGANVAGNSYTTMGVRFIRTTDITEDGYLKDGGVLVPEELVREYLLDDGDVLISRSGTIGRSFLYCRNSHGPCAYAGYLVRFVPTREVLPKYIFLFTKTESFAEFLRVMAITSTIENVNGEKYANCVLPVPPLPEQSAIVRFLAHAGRRTQRYISAKQKLIALLEEQKQVIIQQAVTGQIDVRTGGPYRAYKPAGMEWLEHLPTHWNVRRLKSLVRRIDQGVSPQAESRLADDTSWGVLKAGCVNGGVFRELEHKQLPEEFTVNPGLAVRTGDVLVSRASGSPRFVGSVGRIRSLGHKLILSDKTFRPIFSQVVDPDFMVLTMNCRYYRQQVEQAISGAEGLANNLPLSSLKSFRFAVPSVDEQQSIVDYLQRSTGQLAAAVAIAEREIGLLNELSATLIANAVSGKVDVRKAAAALTNMDAQDDGERNNSGKLSGARRRVGKLESTTENG